MSLKEFCLNVVFTDIVTNLIAIPSLRSLFLLATRLVRKATLYVLLFFNGQRVFIDA